MKEIFKFPLPLDRYILNSLEAIPSTQSKKNTSGQDTRLIEKVSLS